MSDRERWIVYPLLFLSLGISLRSKVAPLDEIQVHRIRCDQIEGRAITAQAMKSKFLECDQVVGSTLIAEGMQAKYLRGEQIDGNGLIVSTALMKEGLRVKHLFCQTLNEGLPVFATPQVQKPRPGATPSPDEPAPEGPGKQPDTEKPTD